MDWGTGLGVAGLVVGVIDVIATVVGLKLAYNQIKLTRQQLEKAVSASEADRLARNETVSRLSQLAATGDALAVAPVVNEIVLLLEGQRNEIARLRLDALRLRLVDLRDGMLVTRVSDDDFHELSEHILLSGNLRRL
ncbi:MAG: hypothetical protein FJ035_04445 [Chloroflexi bacterium]|nr:hypothetical protein [Chloroflexota bacterium]